MIESVKEVFRNNISFNTSMVEAKVLCLYHNIYNAEYDLASCFYSKEVNSCRRVAEALEDGMAGINEGIITYEFRLEEIKNGKRDESREL